MTVTPRSVSQQVEQETQHQARGDRSTHERERLGSTAVSSHKEPIQLDG